MALHTLIQLSCPDHVVAITIKLLMSSLLQYILIGPILPTLSSLMGIMTTLHGGLERFHDKNIREGVIPFGYLT